MFALPRVADIGERGALEHAQVDRHREVRSGAPFRGRPPPPVDLGRHSIGDARGASESARWAPLAAATGPAAANPPDPVPARMAAATSGPILRARARRLVNTTPRAPAARGGTRCASGRARRDPAASPPRTGRP